MSDDGTATNSEDESTLEREIREGRKFSLAEAIGRLAGPGMIKGVSPITLKQQATAEIQTYLERRLNDGNGSLSRVLLRGVGESELLLSNFDRPLVVLAAVVQRVLDSDALLKETVRQADVEWARTFEERPYFQQEGRPPHQDDPYTTDSVRHSLESLLGSLAEDDIT